MPTGFSLKFILLGPDKGWNYPDALFVGKGGMSFVEYKSMFALWCAVKSPLFLGSDLTQIQPQDLKIISNSELIAINQDSLGIQATCVKNCCGKGKFLASFTPFTCSKFQNSWQIWTGPLQNGDFVVILLNRFDQNLEKIEFDWIQDAKIDPGNYLIRDLWLRKNLTMLKTSENSTFKTSFLAAHDNFAFRLIKVLP